MDNTIEVQDDKQEKTDDIHAGCRAEIDGLKDKLASVSKQAEEYFDALQRLAAEFDNYKKRTAKEKSVIGFDTICDVISAFLPVLDNLEKAAGSADNEHNEQSIKAVKDGIKLILRQFNDVMKKFGLEEIKCIGEKFDPNIHNAVMHVKDDNLGESVVVDELQKGFMIQDRVVRHSVVKVAN